MSDPPSPAVFVAPAPADLAPLFPGFEIASLIATGGMGAVYRAVQKSLDRAVAIKILPHEFSNDAAFCEGFEAEAKAMARLNHPNLIGVYDFGEVSGMLYIIMEFVPGMSLFHSANGTAIDPAEVIRIVTGICSGLAHAHDNGIIHRDIKPANILLDLNANPKIGDFGLAHPADRQVHEGEEIFGTPHYTAPEVVSSPHRVDHRADIFSVGVILHELLTGHLPAADPRSASAIIHCDPRFDVIIRRATDPIPENRYHSATEIAKDLHVIASSAGPKVLRTAVPKAVRKPFHSGTKRLPIKQSSGNSLVVWIIIALAAAAAWFFLTGKNSPAPAPAPAPVKTSPAAPVPQHPQSQPPPVPPEGYPPDPTHPPDPEPVIPEPEKHPQDDPDQAPIPVPAPEKPTPEILPKFDVPAFLERARNIMSERAVPLIETHDKDLKANLAAFEKAAMRHIRKIGAASEREKAEEALASLIKDTEENEFRIRTELNRHLEKSQDIKDLYDQCCQAQEAIDLLFTESLAQLSSTYTLGLQKQTERLQAEDDPAAIKLIEEQIENIREDEEYFLNLMSGDQD